MIVDEEELTFGCGEGGRLIGCTFCFNSAHAECCGLEDQCTNVPRGDWACPACIGHARDQLKCDSDDGESESGGGEDVSEEEKSDDSEDDDDDCGDSDENEEESDNSEDDDSDDDENEEESEDSEEDDDVSVLVNWIQNSKTTIRMLKEKCRSVGLKMNGRKHEVVQRLLDHFN